MTGILIVVTITSAICDSPEGAALTVVLVVSVTACCFVGVRRTLATISIPVLLIWPVFFSNRWLLREVREEAKTCKIKTL